MSNVFLCVASGVINVNKFEVRLLPSSHLKTIHHHFTYISSIQSIFENRSFVQIQSIPINVLERTCVIVYNVFI